MDAVGKLREPLVSAVQNDAEDIVQSPARPGERLSTRECGSVIPHSARSRKTTMEMLREVSDLREWANSAVFLAFKCTDVFVACNMQDAARRHNVLRHTQKELHR